MKNVVVIRHANWNFVDDRLTDEGKEKCIALKPRLGPIVLTISSPFERAQETAELLCGRKPLTDERAGILKTSSELSAKVAELRKTHPLGVAGAIISIPELHKPLQRQGEALNSLVAETMEKLADGQQALIVSHDGTIVALEKILTGASFAQIDHTFGELEGLRIDDSMRLTMLR